MVISTFMTECNKYVNRLNGNIDMKSFKNLLEDLSYIKKSWDLENILLAAIIYWNKEIAKLLIENWADPNFKDDWITALMYATKYWQKEIAELLIQYWADINEQIISWITESMFSELLEEHWSDNIVKHLPEEWIDKRIHGKTALMYASEYWNKAIAELLRKNWAIVGFQDWDWRTALIYAICGFASWNKLMAEWLLNNWADSNTRDYNWKTALMYASEYWRLEIVKLLLEHYAIADISDKYWRTALMYANEYWKKEVSKLLLEYYASVDIHDKHWKNTSMYANEYWKIAETLLEHWDDINIEDINTKGIKTFIMAIKTWEQEIIESLIGYWINVNIGLHGKTPLMYASESRRDYWKIEILKLLIAHGADVNMQDEKWRTALMWSCVIIASRNWDINTVELLLEHWANIDIQDINWDTALIIASKYWKIEIVKILIENWANINIQNIDWNTALIMATRYWKIETVSMLLECWANYS